MKKFYLINKKEGETPLQALEVFRRKNKNLKNTKLAYAGRLDPMAEGLLLVLVGEEVKNKEKYLALAKEYEFKILFGFATDTYDILGKVTNSTMGAGFGMKELEKKIKENLKYFRGEFTQKYPPYSSKTVKGKPLFEYARRGKKVKLPSRKIFIKELKLLKLNTIASKTLLADIEKRIKKVKGDFRQKAILETWIKYLGTSTNRYNIASFKIKCTTGTYVRSIANSLGAKMKIPALALSIKRTKIGKWGKLLK